MVRMMIKVFVALTFGVASAVYAAQGAEDDALIQALNAEKAALEGQLSSGTLAYEALQAASAKVGEIMSILDEKELRWLELSEIGQ